MLGHALKTDLNLREFYIYPGGTFDIMKQLAVMEVQLVQTKNDHTIVPVMNTLLISNLPVMSNFFLLLKVIFYSTKLLRRSPTPT